AEGGGDHMGAAVVAVLAQFYHQQTRAAALVAGQGLDLLAHPGEALVALVLRAIDARDRTDDGAVAGEHPLERVRDFANAGAGARGLDGERQEIAFLVPRAFGERVE